jgi:hypothetical protein
MKIYSIIRVGHEYVVRADEQSVLKIASRRKAARLVTDATELLDSKAAPPLSPAAHIEPSIAGDPGITPDPRVTLDPRVTPDPCVTPDPSEVP